MTFNTEGMYRGTVTEDGKLILKFISNFRMKKYLFFSFLAFNFTFFSKNLKANFLLSVVVLDPIFW